MYYLFPLNELGMKQLFASLFVFSMIGIYALLLGVRQLIYPQKNPFKTILLPLMILFTILVAVLTETDVKHIPVQRMAIYSPLFIITFILNYEIPLGYIIYQLTIKRDWISKERQIWFKNLRYFFIINCFYPVIEGLSGISEQMRILDIVNGIFVFSSILLLLSLPAYKSWYLDELKTLSVIDQLERNYSGPIEQLWEKMDKWQKQFEEDQKQMTLPEFKTYLEEIKKNLDTDN